MSDRREYFVDAGGLRCRVLEQGDGQPIYWLASPALLLRWTAIHDALAAKARLILLSLPGMAGNGRNHIALDTHMDWVLAAHDLLLAAGFRQGDTLYGSSTSGALAADVAALWPDLVGRLILVAPHGLYDRDDPTRDIFALHPRDAASLLAEHADRYKAQIAKPDDMDQVLWTIETTRSNEAAARFLWPLGDTHLRRRLGRIKAPTALIWGAQDKIIPPSYARLFRNGISDAAILEIAGAGHVAELDAPEAVSSAVLQFAGATA